MALPDLVGVNVCSVGSGHTESALRECRLLLRERLRLVAVESLVVDTASVAFQNKMTLLKHRKPDWLFLHKCDVRSFFCKNLLRHC